jgi:hypothetical protein
MANYKVNHNSICLENKNEWVILNKDQSIKFLNDVEESASEEQVKQKIQDWIYAVYLELEFLS